MAGAGYKNWTAGDVPTAAQFDTNLQEQTIMVFTDAADRNTQLSTVKAEGMYAFLKDTNVLTVYSGSAWSTVGTQHGDLPTWTPTFTQSGGVSATINRATYQRDGRQMWCTFFATMTGTGTASNVITIGGLPAIADYSFGTAGVATLYDASAAVYYMGLIYFASTTTLTIQSVAGTATANPNLGIINFTAALTTSDIIAGTFSYEAAADA